MIEISKQFYDVEMKMLINKEIITQNGNLQIAWLWFIKYKPTFSSSYLHTNETVELKLSKFTAMEPVYWDNTTSIRSTHQPVPI